MKKLLVIFLAAAFLFAFTGCSETPETASEIPSPTQRVEEIVTSPIIGIVFPKRDAFYERMEQEALTIAKEKGYELLTYYPDSDDQQVTDVYAAIGAGAQCIMIAPRNMDNLQTVLDECDMQDIPVINLMVPINGVVDALICPDYQLMGQKGADALRDTIVEDETVNAFLLESVDGSFISQLVHDGFEAQAADLGTVTITDAEIIQPGEEAAYAEISEQLKYDEEINAVFALDETFAPGVIRAVQESGRDIKIACVGGSRAVMDTILAQEVCASVFVSPVELAGISMDYAVKCAADPNFILPQYVGLTVETIFTYDVEKYSAFGDYADALTNKAQQPSASSSAAAQPSVSPPEETDDLALEE